jgi:hypothetical protein
MSIMGLRSLIAWLRELPISGRKATLSDCPGARLQSRLRVDVLFVADDTGLVRTGERTRLAALRGWLIVEKLVAMDAAACHQYLDGPGDDNKLRVGTLVGALR